MGISLPQWLRAYVNKYNRRGNARLPERGNIVEALEQRVLMSRGTLPNPYRNPALTAYSNDFQGDIGAEWSKQRIDVTPSGRRFLGQFGGGNNGAFGGSAGQVTWTTGHSGSAVQLNGNGGFIDIQPDEDLPVTSGAITVSAWVQFNSVTGTPVIAENIPQNGSGAGFLFGVQNQKLSLEIHNSSSQVFTLSGATALTTGVWYQLTGTFENGTITLYVNGAQDAQSNVGGTLPGGGLLTLGKRKGSTTRYLNGALDDVQVFSRALNSTEVASLPGSTTDGLVAYWKFDENTGTRIFDSANAQGVQLSLANLASHDRLRIAFDLYLIHSWDGRSTGIYGPDVWKFSVDGTTLLNTTFANGNISGQSYPGPYPGGNYPKQTGATEINSLGYGQPSDSVYHFTFDIAHANSTALLNFFASGLQDLTDESWGLDNVQVVPVTTGDLSIDSDNNNGTNLPDGSAAERVIEDDPTQTGKIINVNNDDNDGDGVLDWADGYDLDRKYASNDSRDDLNSSEQFVPLVFQVTLPTVWQNAQIKFDYSGSDPDGTSITRTHHWVDTGGSLRLWAKPGDQARSTALSGLSYIVPGQTYSASALGLAPTDVNGVYTKTVWIEGVHASASLADRTISVSVDPDGSGPEALRSLDSVLVTAVHNFAKPTGLTLTPVGTSQVDLTWNPNTEADLWGYKIYRNTTNDFASASIVGYVSGSNQYTDTGLSSSTDYYYWVMAWTAEHIESAPSDPVSRQAATAALQPQGFAAVANGLTRVDLTWDGRTPPGSWGYKLYRSTTVNFTPDSSNLIDTIAGVAAGYSDTSVSSGHAYYYKLTRVMNDGSQSAPANASIDLSNTIVAPTGLIATPVANSQVQLDWTDNANNEGNYLIEESSDRSNWTLIGMVGANVTTYTTTDLQPEGTYYFRVYADNGTGRSDYSNIAANVTLPATPAMPSGLKATPGYDWIAVDWTNTSSPIDTFTIQQSDDNGQTWNDVQTILNRSTTSYTVDNLEHAHAYRFRVIASNAAGSSTPAEIQTATLGLIPGDPTNKLAGEDQINDGYNLSWTDTADNEDYFLLSLDWTGESIALGGNKTLHQDIKVNAAAGTGSTVSYFAPIPDEFDTPSAVVLSWNVVAVNASGRSDLQPPVAPSNFKAVRKHDQPTMATLTWDDNDTKSISFKIDVVGDDGSKRTYFTGAAAGSTVPKQISYLADKLDSNVNYRFTLTAFNAAGSVAGGSAGASRTKGIIGPAKLQATAISPTEIDLKFLKSEVPAGAKVQRSANGWLFKTIGTWDGHTLADTDHGLYQDTTVSAGTWWYRLVVDNGVISGSTNTVSVSTPGAPAPLPSADPDDPSYVPPSGPDDPGPGDDQNPITPADQGGPGLYRVFLTAPSGGIAGDPTSKGDQEDDSIDVSGRLQVSDEFVQADNAQDAVMQAVSGTLALARTDVDDAFTDEFGDEGFRVSGLTADGSGTAFTGGIDLDTDYSEGTTDWDDWHWDVKAEKLDLAIDSNNDGTINSSDDAVEDNAPGKIIGVHDSLAELKLSVPADLPAGTINLLITGGSDKINLWADANKSNAAVSTEWTKVAGQAFSTSLWVEGVANSAIPGDVRFKLQYQQNGSSATGYDTVCATVAQAHGALSLTVTDSTDATNSVTDSGDLYVTADTLGHAQVEISGEVDLDDDAMWEVQTTANGASPATGDFSSTTTVTLAADISGDFTVVGGFDDDGDGHLESAEIERTINVHFAPIVTITANQPNATEAGPTSGEFTITRSGYAGVPLDVAFTTDGTATYGTDYVDIGTAISFPRGATSVTLDVDPLKDNEVEGPETVVVQLVDTDPTYRVTTDSATVTIADDAPVVSISAAQNGSEDGTVGTFAVTRTGGDLTQPLTVQYFALGGTADEGTDYSSLPGSIQIGANDASATLVIPVIDDSLYEPDETVEIQLDGAALETYTLGSSRSATIDITDNDAKVLSLSVSDPSDATNHISTNVNGTPSDMWILEQAGGYADVNFGASYLSNLDGGDHVLWQLIGNSGSPSSGAVHNSAGTMRLTPANDSARDFTLDAWADNNRNGVADGATEDLQEVRIHVVNPDLDAMTVSNSVASGILPESDEENPGAFVPVNDDDDDYDSSNLPDKDEAGPIADESDLLPVVLHAINSSSSGTYSLTIPSNIRVWQHPDRSGVVSSTTTFASNSDTNLYVEGFSQGVDQLKLNFSAGGHTFSDVDRVRVTTFTRTGALDVPGGQAYRYTASGLPVGLGQWTTPAGGTITSTTNPSDVQITWNNSAQVGRAVFSADDQFVWDLKVNVVEIDVGTPASLNYGGPLAPYQDATDLTLIYSNTFPAHQAMDVSVTIDRIQGPTVPGGGGIERGMKFMEIGFIQNGKWTQDNAVFADGHQKTSSLQDGQWHLDADPGDVWYESFAPSDRNSAYTTIPLATDDTPQMSPTPGMSDNGQAVSRFNLTFDCRLFLAVRTNYGNSQQYNPLGEAHWHFDGSGIIAANGTWTAINGRTGDYGDSVMGTTGFDSIVTDGTTCNVLLNGGSETWH